jgi:hypothetical protein
MELFENDMPYRIKNSAICYLPPAGRIVGMFR